jgi:hypothetical protein
MIDVTEVFCGVVGGGFLFVFVDMFSSKKKKKRVINKDSLNAYPFLWYTHPSDSRMNGFWCPKCNISHTNQEPFKICEDEEYPREHFHFECNACGYKSLMRTVDDPGEK